MRRVREKVTSTNPDSQAPYNHELYPHIGAMVKR
jgi:hypothetical protein